MTDLDPADFPPDYFDVAARIDDLVPPDDRDDDRPGRVSPVVESRADGIWSALLTTDQLAAIPPPAPLIDGLLFRDSLAMLYGPSGVGKSFVAIDLALHVASEREWWNGNRVESGTVLYIVAEGVAGMNARATAWHEWHGHSKGVSWLPYAVDLFDPVWSHSLAVACARLRPSLVVVDTLARSSGAARENATEDMNRIVEHLDRIRLASGACVLIVHHTGKDASAGARGNSALKAAMDTEIELSGDITDGVRVKNSKQKNAAELEPFWLRFQGIDGTESGVLVAGSGKDSDNAGRRMTAAMETLDVLREIAVPEGVASGKWAEAVTVSRATFSRHLSLLVEHGLVENVGTRHRTLYQEVYPDVASKEE